ncbi:hypothetical protein HY641_00670 [Candidatus Woesearchaeota archaeon]|nr:hypothetical protein [Candidatus Woesearchaeota archaeon]
MTEFGMALAMVAPYYNLALVLIVLGLFVKLFRTAQENPDVFIAPWVYLFVAVATFVVEEVVTVLRVMGILPPEVRNLNGFFELVIIVCFVYALLLQRQYANAVFAHPVAGVRVPKKGKLRK